MLEFNLLVCSSSPFLSSSSFVIISLSVFIFLFYNGFKCFNFARFYFERKHGDENSSIRQDLIFSAINSEILLKKICFLQILLLIVVFKINVFYLILLTSHVLLQKLLKITFLRFSKRCIK